MTAHRVRRSLGIVLVALAAALGACGGGSSGTDQYKKDAKAILDPLRTTINSTDSRIRAQTSDRGKLAELDRTRTAVEGAATKLEKLTPPGDAKAEHGTFVRQLHTFGDDIQAVETAAGGKDTAATRTALAKLRTDTAALKKANDALKTKVNG